MGKESIKLVANNKKAYHDYLSTINSRRVSSCSARR